MKKKILVIILIFVISMMFGVVYGDCTDYGYSHTWTGTPCSNCGTFIGSISCSICGAKSTSGADHISLGYCPKLDSGGGDSGDDDTHTCSYTYFISTVSPTCTSQGYDIYECYYCTSRDTKNYVSALGHNHNTLVSSVAATCTTGGYDTYKCSRCSSTTTKNATDALGHSYTWQSDEDNHWELCGVCGVTTTAATHFDTDSDGMCDDCEYVMTIDITGIATIADIEDQVYTGRDITPTPNVTYNSITLVAGEDFTYNYSNNTNVGEATLTVNGMGRYSGSVSTTFNIMGVFSGSISITGENKYNKYLFVDVSSISPNSGNSYEYQWWVADDSVGTNKTNISGADENNYLVDRVNIGKYIGVTVKATKDYYISKSFDAVVGEAVSVDKRIIIGEDSVQVYLDDTKPSVTVEDVLYPTKATVELKDSASGVCGWLITDSNTAPTSGWISVGPTREITLEDYEERRGGQYFVWAIDQVGNVSDGAPFVVIDYVQIKDIVAKVIDEDSGKEKVSAKNGDTIEISIVVDDLLDLTVDEDKITVTIGGEVKEIVNVEIVDGENEGEQIIIVKVVADETEGDVSITIGEGAIENSLTMTNEEISKTFDIVVDNVAPVVNDVEINDNTDVTDSIVVKVTIDADEDAKYVFVSNSSDVPTEESDGWVPYTGEVSHVLSQGDGEKTVYVWAMDEAGNVSIVKTDTIVLKALYISSNSETTLKFKVYDLNLYSSQINKENIEIYLDGVKVDATIVSCENIFEEATATEHFYKVVVKDLNVLTDVSLGVLGIRINGATIYDKAENLLSVTTEVVETEIKVDNIKPEITFNNGIVTATDDNLAYLMVDGNVVSASQGKATYAATAFGEAIAVDKAGNVSELLGKYISIFAYGAWDDAKGVNSPKLMTGMKGIYWDANGNEVEVTADNRDNWYDYDNNNWANAKTEDGSYWVWIPRYAYQIKSGLYTSTAGTIDVEFLQGTTNKNAAGDVMLITYPTVTGDAMNDFVVHPAFVDGTSVGFRNGEWDEDIPGFWVAKYEAGFQASTTSASDTEKVINEDEEIKYSSKNYSSTGSNAIAIGTSTGAMSFPVFKPLTYSYNMITIGDSYTLSRALTESGNIYGLDSSKTDSHMMKNSEWGAVAYLTQSSFGRNGTEITINNKNLNNLNSKNIYAVAGGTDNNASSTGNRTGVFDLSGGVTEYSAAYTPNSNTNGSSFASSTGISSKYTTIYPTTYAEYKSAGYGFGDAILETSSSGSDTTSWYNDYSYFVSSGYPFFKRGGYCYYGGSAGAFFFYYSYGDANCSHGFRVCLVAE